MELEIGGRTARLPQAHVHTEPTTENSRLVYGNLGQDLIRQFEPMTMDFAAMELRFQ